MPATQKQKEFIEILLKKHKISIDLRYEDMEQQDINLIIRQFGGMNRNRFMLPAVKDRYPKDETYLKNINAYLERFKR